MAAHGVPKLMPCCRLKKAEKEKMREMAVAAEAQDKEARRKARK